MRAALAALRFARAEGRHVSGLPVERLAGLAVDMTGSDVRFPARAIEVLDAMPGVWAHFQDGVLSWSQLRGIVVAARPLRVADRQWLDDQLAGAALQGGEPDRIVDIADDLAARVGEQTRPDRDVAEVDRNQMVLQPTLDGTHVTGWFDLDAEGGAALAEATDLAADPPACDDSPVDADGRPMPASWGPCRRRSGQRAEGLVRLATSYLGRGDGDGTPTQARPSCLVVLPADLLNEHDDTDARGRDRPARNRLADRRRQVPLSPRLLWRLPGGRGRITTTTAQRLACDATLIPLALTDDHTPTGAGDATTPITLRQRRAAAAADQGCRFPGCPAPIQWTDLHHVIHREHRGPTVLPNLVSLCHTRVHQRRWTLILHPDRTLTATHGRWTATSRPPLIPPPRATSPPADPVAGTAASPRGDPPNAPPRPLPF